mmetsp:Transcript_5850/g.6732  ORF Transcript_5850/g.6732 Transcript_5850/m.6732 type:complete len:122 (-) Transcript_5850:998-1363(-)
MIGDNKNNIPTATAVPVNQAQGPVYTAQAVTYNQQNPQYQNYPQQAQPQVIYAQPVRAEPVRVEVRQARPTVTRTVITYERYCGPVTVLLGLLLFFFIGPFAILVVFCPCDEMPKRTVLRE